MPLLIIIGAFNILNFIAAQTPTGCVWIGTNKGSVIMMTLQVSPATGYQPRTVKLIHNGNTLYTPLYTIYLCM